MVFASKALNDPSGDKVVGLSVFRSYCDVFYWKIIDCPDNKSFIVTDRIIITAFGSYCSFSGIDQYQLIRFWPHEVNVFVKLCAVSVFHVLHHRNWIEINVSANNAYRNSYACRGVFHCSADKSKCPSASVCTEAGGNVPVFGDTVSVDVQRCSYFNLCSSSCVLHAILRPDCQASAFNVVVCLGFARRNDCPVARFYINFRESPFRHITVLRKDRIG